MAASRKSIIWKLLVPFALLMATGAIFRGYNLAIFKRPCSFEGLWELRDERGRLATRLTVSGGVARREHVPGSSCRAELADGELRMAWEDGFVDVLRRDADGFELLALPRWADGWDEEPRFKLKAWRR